MTPQMRGHLAMLLLSALVAGSFSLGSLAANEITPAALNSVRFLIAAILIGSAASLTVRFKKQYFIAPWRYLILGGLLAVYFVLMFEGLKTATPISTAAVFTLTPIISAGFGYLLLRQMVTARMALALGIGAVGALWVIFRADISAILQFQVGAGEMAYFWGCVAHAIYTPMVRKLNRGEPAVIFSFGTLITGFAILIIYGWNDLLATNWQTLPAIVWITLAYIAIAASAISFVLLQFATLQLPAAKVMAYTYLIPCWVIVWEISLGNPVPSSLVLIGMVLTIAALWLLLKDEAS